MEKIYENDIAIIGMAGRFPNANDLDAFWDNLAEGRNSFTKADDTKVISSGISSDLLNDKRFVNSSSKLEDAKYFDADFFNLSNTEATLMDPQIRLLLQTSWHALEDAGYAINNLDVAVGNFCGMSTNTYLMKMIDTNALNEAVDPLLYRILNDKDFLATWVSYKLNLTGPAMTIQTACSSSLLSIHLACQSLLNMECTMALAGGSCYDSEENIGYLHVPGSIYSKDGVCRPFDSNATGTVVGEGVGAILLKRAEDAIRDKDNIYALIKSTAVNNDGSNKQGYTTPSVDFQRDMILEALAVADINPETIGFIEAHGTGTSIGDPIEVSALTEAYREYTDSNQFCAISSLKGNIGHLDAAAGVASAIKAALSVNKGFIVPNANFSTPNPAIDFKASPFYVNQKYIQWPDHFEVRRAGVSSLGVGGTNVHLIVEEPPNNVQRNTPKGTYLFRLTAKNKNSLQAQKNQLVNYLSSNDDVSIDDLEFTSLYGRGVMPYRFSTTFKNKEELIDQLKGIQNENCYEGYGEIADGVFMFPGQGSQYANMAKGLYANNASFRKNMDYCFEYVESTFNLDVKTIIFSDDTSKLNNTENTQITLFIVEYCLAKELLKSGIKPKAVIGHSLGEYVAACIVDCISVEDGLKLVYHRGRLMGGMADGAMALVRTTKDKLKPLLVDQVSICAYNAPGQIVVGGPEQAMEQQKAILEASNIASKRLRVSHAYHTPMMQQAANEFKNILEEVEFKPFDTKVFSTYTGDLVDHDLFCSNQYWIDQILNPVKFQSAIEVVSDFLTNPLFIEVGPGNGLSYFIQKIFDQKANTVNLLPKSINSANSSNTFINAKALIAAKGLVFNSPEEHTGQRVSLPGYVFTKKYFWKPNKNISYNNFEEISQAYHNNNQNFLGDRLRSIVELKVESGEKISDDLLIELNDIHNKYIANLEKLFSKNGVDAVNNKIEVLYKDISLYKKSNQSKTENEFNRERNINAVYVEPSTETEKLIATLWGEVLGYKPVGVLDNYFEVGGNSLLATQLINRINSELELELAVSDVLLYGSVKDIALLIDEKKWLRSDVELSNELII